MWWAKILPACRFAQVQLFLKELELGLLVAELGSVVVQAKLPDGHHLLPVLLYQAAIIEGFLNTVVDSLLRIRIRWIRIGLEPDQKEVQVCKNQKI